MFKEVECNPYAKMLYNDLLKQTRYNKLIRPVANFSDKLTVKLGLKLSQLIDVVSIGVGGCVNVTVLHYIPVI